MLWYTITAHPIVEARTVKEKVAVTASYKEAVTQGDGADAYTFNQEGATSNTVEASQVTRSNGDLLSTNKSTVTVTQKSTLIDDTVGTNTGSSEQSETQFVTELNSWNGKVQNSDFTAEVSQTANYSWNTGYTHTSYTFFQAIEGSSETMPTTLISGATTKTTTGSQSQNTVVATTVSASLTVTKPANLSQVVASAMTVTTVTLPPLTLWQTSSLPATLAEYTALYQGFPTTFSKTYHGLFQTFSDETYTPITEITGATGSRGTRTVVLLETNEVLRIPTATGLDHPRKLCSSIKGPATYTISGVFSTRPGSVFDEQNIESISTYTTETTRTVTTSLQTTTKTTLFDGIVPGGNPAIWTNPWPISEPLSAFRHIPASSFVTFTHTETGTTTSTEQLTSVSVGGAKTESQISWSTTWHNTTTPDGLWQSTCFSFATQIHQKRIEGTQNTNTTTEETTTASNGGTTSGQTSSYEKAVTWVENVLLWTETITSNPLYATITFERSGQSPLSNLSKRAKVVSIANTTVTAWRPAAAMSKVDFVAAAYPQSFEVKNTAENRTTTGSLWGGGYSETIADLSSSTSISGAWVAEGMPDTTWKRAEGFANTGKNQRGDVWTRVRLPNIVQTVGEDGISRNVTFRDIFTYAATFKENAEKAKVILVNSTGGSGQYLVDTDT